MAVIKSGVSSDVLTVDPTSKAARVTLYNSLGNEISSANPLYVNTIEQSSLPNSLGTYSAASWRIIGTATTSQVLMTIRNNAGSSDIAIRRLAVDVNYSAAAVDLVQAYFRFWLNTGTIPIGGSAPTKWALDSTYPASQAATEVLFAASADGVAAAITHATPASTPTREQGKANILTAVGSATNIFDYELNTFEQHPLWVRSNEIAALILVGSAVDIVSHHYTVKVVWEEV